MSEGGVSYGQVVNIVEQHVAPIQREVNQLDRRLDRVDHRLEKLEQEMANIEGAVKDMHRGLAGELERLRDGNKELIRVQESTQHMTLAQFTAANVQLGMANSNLGELNNTSIAGFNTVSAGVDRMAQAIVQTEVIRLLHEAKEPTERVNSFAEEIEQRFAKTIESVYFVRAQHDQLLATAMTEYERKLRVIGEHIYRVYEDDFREWAEVPLSEPSGRIVELAMAMDEQRVAHRTEALEARFETLGDELIEPILSAHRDLEHMLASRFACKVDAAPGEEVAIPLAACLRSGGALEVLGIVKMARLGERLELVQREGAVIDRATVNAARIGPQLQSAPLSGERLQTLKDTLTRLAAEHRIDSALLPGYIAYLDQFGLSVLVDQDVRGR